jgi:TolB-like protein
MSLFAELRRRNVVRVGLAYAVIGWFLAQIAEFAFENFGAPDWVLKTVVVLLLLGLPIALFFAWAFEMTPEGVKLEKDVDRSQSITQTTGRKLDRVIIAALVVALVYFVWERQETNEPVEMADVADATDAAIVEESPDSGPDKRSIAVLPFVNMSSDKEQEWFSDGLTEEILNALARTPDLLVAARTSSFKYKGMNEDVPTIAAALGVAHILEGTVRRGRDHLRVTAQLIRASDGFHLWSQTYDRKPEDVIALQEEVAIEIAVALQTAMDPEALAKMVSSGTNSVPAYNAYLEALAYGVSTLSTGDVYVFLSAREALERAIALDPGFALAYWELARFWTTQTQTTNIGSGIVEISLEEVMPLFDDAIDKAIEHESDPVNQIRSRVLKAAEHLRLRQALRLNTAYLSQRPNDQIAQTAQLSLLADLNIDDRLKSTIAEFQKRGGYDVILSNNSLTYSLISNDKPFIRAVATTALERIGDSAFVVYQAHRSLLWAGDIDGASRLLPILRSSDLPEESRQLVALRQACAEGRHSDAARIYDRINSDFPDDFSIIWISNRIMSQDERAFETLIQIDETEDLGSMRDYLAYAFFDARPFPNLMALLESQGVEPREPLEIPYRCKL